MHSYSYSLTRSEMNARRVNAECREDGDEEDGILQETGDCRNKTRE